MKMIFRKKALIQLIISEKYLKFFMRQHKLSDNLEISVVE